MSRNEKRIFDAVAVAVVLGALTLAAVLVLA